MQKYNFFERTCIAGGILSSKKTGAFAPVFLFRRIQHILDKDPVAPGGVIDQNMGDGSHQPAVLYNRTAAHE